MNWVKLMMATRASPASRGKIAPSCCSRLGRLARSRRSREFRFSFRLARPVCGVLISRLRPNSIFCLGRFITEWSVVSKGSHDKNCLNTLNAKERCFNASFLIISFLITSRPTQDDEMKGDNVVPQLFAAVTFKATHHSAVHKNKRSTW